MSRRLLPTLLASLIVVAAPSAAGQTSSEGLEVQMRLVSQPPWHQPKDRISIEVELTNVGDEALGGYNLEIAVHSRLSSRSRLHSSFDGDAGFQTSSYTIDRTDTVLGSGTSHTVTVEDPITTLNSLASAPDDGGVYPLTLSLYDAEGAELLDVVSTSLILYPRRAENPLNLSLVVPLNDVPARDPDGVFRPGTDDRFHLEEAVTDGGWIDGVLDALIREVDGGLHVGLAPSPRLIEELGDMADGYRRAAGDEVTEVPASSDEARAAADALDRLRGLASNAGVQPILTPYANPDLASLVDFPERDWFAEHLTVAEDVLSDNGLAAEREWIFSPGNRVDAATLEQFAFADAGRHTFFGDASLVAELDPAAVACPDPRSPTSACPVRVEVPDAVVEGYAADAPLQARLLEVTRNPDPQNLQRFYAELAMIHSELPGTTRVVQASLPSWQPAPEVSAQMFDVLRRALWLRTVTPEEGLELGLPAVERTIVPDLPHSPAAPSDSLYADIGDASDVVDTFAEIRPPDVFLEELNRNLLVAQSRTWWTNEELTQEGAAYTQQTGEIARGELEKVSVRAPGEITLTSEEGEITLSLVNRADYPVTVRIVPTSDDVVFDPPSIEDTFEPGGASQFRVDVRSESSGIFPVNVALETPNGTPIRPISLRVRSTSFNDFAVAITLGALAFLILWYVLRGVQKRRALRRSGPEAASS